MQNTKYEKKIGLLNYITGKLRGEIEGCKVRITDENKITLLTNEIERLKSALKQEIDEKTSLWGRLTDFESKGGSLILFRKTLINGDEEIKQDFFSFISDEENKDQDEDYIWYGNTMTLNYPKFNRCYGTSLDEKGIL